jgi:hypothetical protein
LVVCGGFVEGRYAPHAVNRQAALPTDVEGLITGAVALGSGLLGPAGKLLEQLVNASLAGYRLVERMHHTSRASASRSAVCCPGW